MALRRVAVGALVALLALALWRAELFTVQRPGERPRDLETLAPAERTPAPIDVALPQVPVGALRLRGGGTVVLVHYWAPWQRHASLEAAALDSLRRAAPVGMLIALVTFDPFPSVARYVARRRLAVPVLLDVRGRLRERLPCPSIPFTYVLDRAGRVAVRQAGEVDWLSAGTRAALRSLIEESAEPEPTRPAAALSGADNADRGVARVSPPEPTRIAAPRSGRGARRGRRAGARTRRPRPCRTTAR